jgi:hypothetical protein
MVWAEAEDAAAQRARVGVNFMLAVGDVGQKRSVATVMSSAPLINNLIHLSFRP